MMPWIIFKTETLLFYRKELRDFLYANHFCIIKTYHLRAWNEMSLQLYKKSQSISIEQLQLQNIGRKQILGRVSDEAEKWILEYANTVDMISIFEILTKLKYEFRKMFWISGLTIRFEYEGNDTIYHFSYFHVPDSEIDNINSEWEISERYIDYEVDNF